MFCHSGFVSDYVNDLFYVMKKTIYKNKTIDNYLKIIRNDSYEKINLINNFITKILYSLYEVYS